MWGRRTGRHTEGHGGRQHKQTGFSLSGGLQSRRPYRERRRGPMHVSYMFSFVFLSDRGTGLALNRIGIPSALLRPANRWGRHLRAARSAPGCGCGCWFWSWMPRRARKHWTRSMARTPARTSPSAAWNRRGRPPKLAGPPTGPQAQLTGRPLVRRQGADAPERG